MSSELHPENKQNKFPFLVQQSQSQTMVDLNPEM